MKLFLIDDEIVALNALKKRVDWLKYGFTEVYTAQETGSVREFLKKEAVDFILCDVEMHGENGLDFIKDVKRLYPKTECIIVTCHAEFDYIQRAMRYGVSDYILKPIDYQELEDVLLKTIHRKQDESQKLRREDIIEQTVMAKLEKEPDVPTDEQTERIDLVKAYVEQHIRERITVKDLAELVHVNEQYLMRIFKKETGKSVVEYITEQRMFMASDLLRNTDLSINFIADCVGCENYSYFTKLFKKYTDLTPREYRAQFKKS